MRLRTAGYQLIYDMTTDRQVRRGQSQLGFLPADQNISEMAHPFGLQMQILLPLTNPTPRSYALAQRGKPAAHTLSSIASPKVVPVGAYFTTSPRTDQNAHTLESSLISLANVLMEEPNARRIVYDFGGHDWTEEEVAFVLHSQKRRWPDSHLPWNRN